MQESGYPNNTKQANVSKETTLRELLDIEGIDKELFMTENINLMFGEVSHLQYCENMFNFPDVMTVDNYFVNELKKDN